MDDEPDPDDDAAARADRAAGADAIDLVKLAEKVHELMREDLRLERARGAAVGSPRRW